MLLFFLLWMIIFYGYVNFRMATTSIFHTKVKGGEVAEIEVKGQKVNGRFAALNTETQGGNETQSENRQSAYFSTVLPSFADPELMGLLENRNVVIKAETDQGNWFAALLISLLPWLLIVDFLMVRVTIAFVPVLFFSPSISCEGVSSEFEESDV